MESSGRSSGVRVDRQLDRLGPLDRSASLLVGRTYLSGTAMSLVGGDPGVPMSHRSRGVGGGLNRPAKQI
jgi:hypothetical protein